MPRQPRHSLAARIMSRIDELAAISSIEGEITRLYLTPEHRRAANLVARWMREAGLETEIDGVATVVGRMAGTARSCKTLLIGSHIDTVRNAGRFDGTLGVVMAIEVMAELNRLGSRLPYNVEILAFGDEEGIRFPRTLIGSRAIAGTVDNVMLDAVDSQGISVREALAAFGCDPGAIGGIARRHTEVLGYVEVHIEQGPILEKDGMPVGIVTAISGATRLGLELRGRSGHAGTLPMQLRRDALAGAAEIVLAVERIARDTNGLVATVGKLDVSPGAVNVVPGRASMTIDVRSPVEGTRRRGIRDIELEIRNIARKRQLTHRVTETYAQSAATCDHRFIRQLTAAADHLGVSNCGLPSGAGHDGQAISRLCPIGMLFVRCKGGISHHPDESVKPEDVEVAARVLIEFLGRVSPTGRALA